MSDHQAPDTSRAPMTVSEFLALEPVQQSALVAEHVMGFVWRRGLLGNCRGLVPPGQGSEWPEATGKEPVAADSYRFVPGFAVFSRAAQEVWDALHLRWYSTLTNDTPDDNWHMRLRHRRTGQGVKAAAPTDSLAICAAAMLAVGAVVPDPEEQREYQLLPTDKGALPGRDGD